MSKTTIYIGTSGWNYDHWDKVFYPEDLPKSKRFEYYIEHFNAVEVNATFYRTFRESTYKKWYDKAPQGFRYFLKVPRFMSHRKHLNEVSDDSVERFIKGVRILKSKCGGVLLQIGPNTSPDEKELKEFLQKFNSVKVAVEFRSDKWFEEKYFSVLDKTNTIFVDTDSPMYSLQWQVTGNSIYVRLHGKHEWYKYDYPSTELGKLAKKINNLKKGKVKDIFLFFNNDFKGFAPQNALKLKEFLKG